MYSVNSGEMLTWIGSGALLGEGDMVGHVPARSESQRGKWALFLSQPLSTVNQEAQQGGHPYTRCRRARRRRGGDVALQVACREPALLWSQRTVC